MLAYYTGVDANISSHQYVAPIDWMSQWGERTAVIFFSNVFVGDYQTCIVCFATAVGYTVEAK